MAKFRYGPIYMGRSAIALLGDATQRPCKAVHSKAKAELSRAWPSRG